MHPAFSELFLALVSSEFNSYKLQVAQKQHQLISVTGSPPIMIIVEPDITVVSRDCHKVGHFVTRADFMILLAAVIK